MISDIFTNKIGLDEYLSRGGTPADIISAVENKLNPYARADGIPDLTDLDYPTALKYLNEFWYINEHEENEDIAIDAFTRAGEAQLPYILPYLYWMYPYIRDEPEIEADVLKVSSALGDIKSVQILLDEGVSLNNPEAIDASIRTKHYDIVDLFLSRGYLEQSNPTKEQYFGTLKSPQYSATGRPKTYMLGMCKRVGAPEPIHFYLPVLRYQSIYHEETEKKFYCGTFYFFDPESTVYLDMGRTAIFGSKFHATYVLHNALLKQAECPEIKDFLCY